MSNDQSDLLFPGKNISLIPLAFSHIEDLLSAATEEKDPTYSLTWVPDTAEKMKAYIESALKDRANKKAVPFAVFDKRANKIVGSTRFGNLEYWIWPQPNHPLQRGNTVPDAVEIGWTWLAKSAQRTGINTEMKLLMLTHAFEVWQVHRVQFKADSRNEKSRKALERFGIQLDGVLRANMPAYDGKIRDTAYYSILSSEWPKTKERIVSKLY